MKLHRFYVDDIELVSELWLDEPRLVHQWRRVLRFEVGREVELFNAKKEDKLYRIKEFSDNAVLLELVTEFETRIPKNDVYLCFAMLKKDKNEWVLQKATELGVSHFIPLLTDRTEKTGWDMERAQKIVIEAAEQCERSDIPRIREPLHIAKLIEEFEGSKIKLIVAEQGSSLKSTASVLESEHAVGVLIGPEGGWSDAEKELFKDKQISRVSLSEFTLRAETAAVTAAALLQ